MKSLSQEEIKRMVEGGSGGSGGDGIDPSALAGLASQGWVEGNYVSKSFFNSLFTIHTKTTTTVTDENGDPVGTPTVVTGTIEPNETVGTTSSTDESTGYTTTVTKEITSIEAMKGLCTDYFLSALGLNDAGGSGGVMSLSNLVDVDLNNPTNGQALVYNATAGKWENQTIGGGGSGTLTSIGLIMPTGFAVNPATLTADGSFNVSFATGYALPTTADVNKGVTAYGWGNHASAGYLTGITAAMINTALGFTLSGTASETYNLTTISSNASHGETAYGWGNHASAGYWGSNNHPTTLGDYGITDAYTKTQADAKFMTIAAFENLFNAIGSDGSTKINHPYASGVSSIKAMVGLWTNQYLSALGLNDSGGGGGATLNEPLASINTALLGMPTQTGQVITWNGSQWIYTIPSGGGGGGTGTVTSITAGTGLSGGTITTMGTIAISTTYQGYISEGHTAYGWGNHASAGYLTGITAAMINAALGFTLSGTAGATYNLTTISINASHGETAFSWGNHADAGYLTGITATMINSALGFKISGKSGRTYNLNTISNNAEDGETAFGWGNHADAGYLTGITSSMVTAALGYTPVPNTTTWWGQSIVNGTVTGNLSSVESITMSESIVGLKSLEFNTSGELQGYGGFLDFHYNGSLADFTSRIIEETSGVLSIQAGSIVNNEFVGAAAALVVGIGYNGSSITIGNGKLVWDETNNSLKVIRSNGSAANIYATGGVSALGMQAGVSALDAMTFNYVTINNNLEFGAASRITHAVTADDRTLYIGNSDNSGWVALQDVCSQRGISYWKIMANGEAFFAEKVQSPKFYLDDTRYLYLDGSNNLMFFNGSTAKQVAFIN